MTELFFLLKITLAESSPEIWRKFVVPKSISLDRLHDVIQIVMGWQDYHQHEFVFGEKHFTEFPQKGDPFNPSSKAVLGKLVKRKGATFSYIYDWGDDWTHELVVEETKVDPRLIREPLFCTAGERACPPEDVGGIFGYQEFCEAMSKPKHPRHKELKEWYGKPLDAEYFNPALVNQELVKYWRWSRDRVLNWNQFPV